MKSYLFFNGFTKLLTAQTHVSCPSGQSHPNMTFQEPPYPAASGFDVFCLEKKYFFMAVFLVGIFEKNVLALHDYSGLDLCPIAHNFVQ